MNEPRGTPLVRRLAGDWGVDLAAVDGTGVGGRVTKDDVIRAAAEQLGQRLALASAVDSDWDQDPAEVTPLFPPATTAPPEDFADFPGLFPPRKWT